MAILATDAIVADMALLATDAIVVDMALLASDAVIAMELGCDGVLANTALATADVVTDMNVLGTADVVTDMNVLGTSANVTAMGLLGTSTVVANMATVSANVAGVNSFAERYRVALVSSSGGSITTGTIYYNTTGGSEQLYIWDGSAWQAAAFSTSGTVTSFNTRTGSVTLSSADVTGALSTGAIATAKIADDAITADKMADDAVGISVLSATGTPGSGNFLRGDNTWTAVSTDPTMGGDLSGTASNAQIVASAVGATELNVTGNGTSGQALTSDADGSMTWATIEGASASGAIYENSNAIAANFTFASNKNGMSVGPITINSGVTVTVPSGANWVVL